MPNKINGEVQIINNKPWYVIQGPGIYKRIPLWY